MQTSSFLHKARALLRRSYTHLRTLFRNRYFWGGLGILLAVGLVLYVLVNSLLMPALTRHNVAVQVPNVLNQSFEAAQEELAKRDLRAKQVRQDFKRDLPRDVIIDQDPEPGEAVKPGRRIYLTVNTGQVPMVDVPRVLELSLREAVNRLQSAGLLVEEPRPDSIPSPHRNTITRQTPRPGTSVKEGTRVTVWYSTGLGERYVTIPDVTGMTVQEAEETLLRRNLRAVVVGDTFEGLGEPTVQRQSRAPGTRVREGFELRLFLDEE